MRISGVSVSKFAPATAAISASVAVEGSGRASGMVIVPAEARTSEMSRAQIFGSRKSNAVTCAPCASSTSMGPIAAPAPSSTKCFPRKSAHPAWPATALIESAAPCSIVPRAAHASACLHSAAPESR